jgi:hypothetical protein
MKIFTVIVSGTGTALVTEKSNFKNLGNNFHYIWFYDILLDIQILNCSLTGYPKSGFQTDRISSKISTGIQSIRIQKIYENYSTGTVLRFGVHGLNVNI